MKADGKPVVICTPTGAGVDGWPPYTLDMDATTYLIVARLDWVSRGAVDRVATHGQFPLALISSDGLWDFASDELIMKVALEKKAPNDICKELIREARMGGSEDDVTVIAVR